MQKVNPKKNNIETIIFDLDDTLISSHKVLLEAFGYAVEPFGIRLSVEQIEAMRGMSDKELFIEHLERDQANIALKRLWEYSFNSANKTTLIPGVAEILENLRQNSIQLGVWTARDKKSALNILKIHNIDDYFQEVIGGNCLKTNKPNPAGLIMLSEKISSSLDNMMHIGDHEHDIIGANSAGVTSGHAKWQDKDFDDITMHEPEFIFHTVDEFGGWAEKYLYNKKEKIHV